MRTLWGFAFGLVFVACVSDAPVGDAGKQAGTRGGPCLPMNACVAPLSCIDSTCIELPDSGVADGTTTDAPNDSVTMMDTGADSGCGATPTLDAKCSMGTPFECVTNNPTIECLAGSGECATKAGKDIQCWNKSQCMNGGECCLDNGATRSGSCPTTIGLTSATWVTYCSMTTCTKICTSDLDCGGNTCLAAVIANTTIRFGYCSQ